MEKIDELKAKGQEVEYTSLADHMAKIQQEKDENQKKALEDPITRNLRARFRER